ncbi:methyltransferase domain-containing protein [Candidatus Woesearchaeota archaeon]|nr:methyltransferase domain-containing protein [Candidatus Woesearchaeota archaeon]
MKDYEKITVKSYDENVEEYIRRVGKSHPYDESKKFLSLMEKGDLILDVGCGPGRDARIFIDKGFRVMGIDLSKKMIATAKKRVKEAEFKVMDVKKLDFEDNSFDGLWAHAIYIHLPKKNLLKALKEAYRVLKDDGIFFLSVKQGKEGEVFKPDVRYKGAMKFWSYFNEKEIVDFVKKAGFTVLDSYVVVRDPKHATHPWIYVFCRKYAIYPTFI